MEKRPIIGITPSNDNGAMRISPRYAEAVFAAGGIPVILPYTESPEKLRDYAGLADALLFSGGPDVAPSYYGEETLPECGEIDTARDAFEFALFREFLPTGKPILGICRGMQFLNVALGGSLYQHIEGHRQTEGREVFDRTANIVPDTRLSRIVGTKSIKTNSFHHQAVKTPAPGVVISAHASDGTAEAIESPSHPFLVGVQWHPEVFHDKDEHAMAIFRAFIEAI